MSEMTQRTFREVSERAGSLQPVCQGEEALPWDVRTQYVVVVRHLPGVLLF
jgi:hypothetical protein